MRLLLPVLLGLMPAASAAPFAPTPARIVKIAGTPGHVWLLFESGRIADIDRAGHVTMAALPAKAFDLCGNGGAIVAAVRNAAAGWALYRLADDGWRVIATIKVAKESPVALACTERTAMLLTSRRLISVDVAGQHEIALSGEALWPARVSAVAIETQDALYLGKDDGEWGGGLRRVDRRTGHVEVIDRNDAKSLCGGPLNSECDPVNGLAISPWKPDCVLAAVGLVHMAPHGRIVEVCGKTVRRLYYRAYPTSDQDRTVGEEAKRDGDDEPFSTDAFFGMTAIGDSVWVSGTRWMYRFDGSGDPQIVPMPAFRQIDGIQIADMGSGLTLVLSDINRKASVSGAIPILAAR